MNIIAAGERASSRTGERDYGAVLADAVRVLTEAGRLTHPEVASADTISVGTGAPGRIDFAEFVTLAVAGAAANLGGIEPVLSGRPGSWEAGCVRSMLTSTVGEDDAALLAHRTEPVTVVVTVDDVLLHLGYGQLYDQAEDELTRRDIRITATVGPDEAPAPEQAAALDAIGQLRDALDELRQRDYIAYGQAFTATVHRAAVELFPTLPVPVQVRVETVWRNHLGSGEAFDGPEFALWDHAREHTPLPGSGLPPADYPPRREIADVEREQGRDPLARLHDAPQDGDRR